MKRANNDTLPLFSVVCLLSVSYIIYSPVLGFGFITGWDDNWMVINRYTETWSRENFRAIFGEFYHGQYGPVNQVIYTAIHHFSGYNPGMFHLVCLAFHAANSILVFLVLRQLLFVNNVETQKATVISFLVALLFVAHPLQVESVAWISASKILVYTFFYLLAIRFYLIYFRKGSVAAYLLLTLFFALSFGGKEQAVTFPVCLLWIDLICRRNFRDWRLWVEKIPLFALAGLFAYISMKSHATSGVGLLSQNIHYPFMHRIVFACYSLCEYVVKIAVPVNLLYIYPFPMSIGEPLPQRFPVYPALLLLILFGFWKFWKQRPVWLGLSWFLIHIALLLHIIPLARAGMVADRYVYLALPGILFIPVHYFFALWETKPKLRKLLAAAGLIWVLFLCISSYHRTYTWSDNDRLKEKYKMLLDDELKTKN